MIDTIVHCCESLDFDYLHLEVKSEFLVHAVIDFWECLAEQFAPFGRKASGFTI